MRTVSTMCFFHTATHGLMGRMGPYKGFNHYKGNLRLHTHTHTHSGQMLSVTPYGPEEEQGAAISAFNKTFWEIYSNCLFTVMVCLDKHERGTLTFDVF